MDRISRFCVCRRSLLRRNPFTRWPSEPSLISNNPTSTLISKGFHHTFNYPPAQIFSIPGNQSQNFRGEAFGDAYVKKEISQLWEAIDNARDDIETSTLPPADAIEIMADRFHASKEKLGLDIEKKVHFPPHLRKFTKKIRSLKTYFDDVVDYGEYFVKSGGRSFTEYEDLCYPLTCGHFNMPVDDGDEEIDQGAQDKKQDEEITYIDKLMGLKNGTSRSSVHRQRKLRGCC